MSVWHWQKTICLTWCILRASPAGDYCVPSILTRGSSKIASKCVILRQEDAAHFPASPAWIGGLAFLRTALKAAHLTKAPGVGGTAISDMKSWNNCFACRAPG